MTISNEHLQSIIDGEIGVIDSTQAVSVARELLAMRKFYGVAERYSQSLAGRNELYAAMDECDAARKAAE